jgi:hypothetical protein
LVVRKLTVLNNFQFDPPVKIAFETATVGDTGVIRVNAKQFNVSHYVIKIHRGGQGPTLLFPDHGTTAPVPFPPRIGEIEIIATSPESGDQILVRQAAPSPDSGPEKPAFRHLVSSTTFDCNAWLKECKASAMNVKTWPGGVTSTLDLQCSAANTDVGLGVQDYSHTGSRVENGTFAKWNCLDCREVITGGTPGSDCRGGTHRIVSLLLLH